MPKKKEIEMPKLGKSQVKKSWWIATGIGIAIITTVAIWARFQTKEEHKEYVAKGVVTNYVCKIVGADPEQNMVAVQCLTK